MLSWTRLCVNTVLYGLLLILIAVFDVSALEVALSSSSSTYYYEIALGSDDVANSSRFLFTLAPLDHVLESVIVTDATEMQSTVQLSQQFGLHALSLSEFTAPVYIWFSIPSPLPLTNVITGVGCFENSESLEVHCRYLPTGDLAQPKYIATVVPLDAENKKYGLHFQLPYLLTSIDVAHQYRAMVVLNNIFSVSKDDGLCRDPDLFIGSSTTQCALNVVPSTTPKYPSLPYEAILPLKSYSHARALATFVDNLIVLSLNITHVKPRASLLDYIAQHARIVSDPYDTDLFRVFALNESEPSEILYPDEDPGFGRYIHMSPVKNNWIPEVPPVESLFLRGLIGVFDVIVPGDGETPPSTSAMTGIMMVAGDQGFYMRDTLQITVNVNLQVDDTFISQYASCSPLLPQNITCVLTSDVPRLSGGTSAFSIHSKAFERVDELTVSIKHDVPKTAAISYNPYSDVQMASLAGHATQLQPHFKAFNNLVLKSSPRASGSEVNIYHITEPEYYESSLTTVHADMTNVLTNQYILVELGCLLETSDLLSKNDMCTRVANRIYSCPSTYGVSEALHGDPYSVNIDKFMWHRDIGYRASPVILKRVLINDPTIALETSSTNVHSSQAFRFETSSVSATIRRENTTLTADFRAEQVPRLMYPSVDRFVFNATAPLFRDALAQTLTIAGTFTPLNQVTSESADPNAAPVETWELDTAAVAPLECYPVTAFAVACLVTAETVATHGQVSVTLVHDQPAAAPQTMSISMSIYTSTDISACGGRDPIEATPAALRVADVPANDGSSSVASAYNGFVTADADIAAARRHVQRLAAEWRTHSKQQAQRMQMMSKGMTLAAVSTLESSLPSDWSLAHMSTKADVQVTVLWSPPTSTSTFWALNPAVIWLWPFLGAVLLAVVAYRIYVIRRRKSAAVHPGTLVTVCEKESGRGVYMASHSADGAPQKHCDSYFLPIAAEPHATRDARSCASGPQSAAEIELAAKYQSDDAHASVDIQCDMEVESVHDEISGGPIESASVPQTCTTGVDVLMTSELAMALPPVARASSLFIAPTAHAQSYADVMSLNTSELRKSMESYLPIASSFLRRKSFETASPILSRFSPNLADTQRISANAPVNIVLTGALDEIRSVTPFPLEILESTSLRSSLTSLAVSSECISPRSSHFTTATTVCKSAAAISDVSFADRSSNASSSSGISNELSDDDIKPGMSVVSARDMNHASQCRPVVPVLTLPLVPQIITQTPLSLLSDPRASFKGRIATPHGTEPREYVDSAQSVSCGLHTRDAHSHGAVITPVATTMPVWSAGDKSAIIGLDQDITHLSIGSEHDSLSNNSEPMLIYQPPLSPVSDYSLRNEVRQIIGYPEPSISGDHFLLSTRSLPANLREREAM